MGSRSGFTQKQMKLAAVPSRAPGRELALGFICSLASATFSKIQYFTAVEITLISHLTLVSAILLVWRELERSWTFMRSN